ncbi:MAG: 2-C-methyl-D-erythritol 4-phosphate cytidylyltransferase [Candidatus Dichloromethanomonas elyunquensis]|nr:MAG: 2-C-methyl-D-erythritol 4-phosphate cytidylyltransferase [Candidatus Dichloromethanomonas elyunquensis]
MKSTCLAEISAIIPSAGQGKRMGGQGNKLFLKLAGTPILLLTLDIFQHCSYIKEIIIPASGQDIPLIRRMVEENGLSKVSAIIEGGKERQDSVCKALQALGPEAAKIVIHDGARPLLTLSDLEYFIENTRSLDAAIMAVPVKDTIKRIDGEGWVAETPVRESLRLIQTPQLFDRILLEKVHILASRQGYYTTDDAALMEWQGYRVKIIEGYYDNIKVTTPEDILLAEAILQRRKGV